MPAITLARLRQQAALVVYHFDNPAALVRSLHHLFDFYADRTHRPGQTGLPGALLAAYNVPAPVLRQIKLEISPRAEAEPQKALDLCDALWEESYLEFRILAASILGLISAEFASAVFDRVREWAKHHATGQLADIILDQGLARLRSEKAEQVIEEIEKWLASPDAFLQQLGLRALLPLLASGGTGYANIPALFHLLNPYVRTAPSHLKPDLVTLLQSLAHSNPHETAYFLRQVLEISDHPDTAWLIRQCLPAFPPASQASLRSAM